MLHASARDSWQVLTDRLGAFIVLEAGQRDSCATGASCAATVVNPN